MKEGKQQPRRFFTNIAGATTEENPNAFPWVERLPDHNDWTQLPDGSFVMYDEAHSDGKTPGLERYGLLFPSTGKPGESEDPRIRAMSTHRHRGVDLVFVTQWPSKIHHQVRLLIGTHIHMNRAMGSQRAGMLTWSRVQPDPYDERQREKAEEEIWAFPKGL
ncbi:zonular occludens toxin domain-containing protein [Xanthomonas euroxanthea]